MTDNHTGIDTSAVQRLAADVRCGTDSTMRHSAYAIMKADDNGDYVTWEAYRALSAELTAARECIANLEKDQGRSEKVIADANEALAWKAGAEAMRKEGARAAKANNERLESALCDLVSWFTTPSQYGPWIIKAGEHGVDAAVKAARAALKETKHD